MAANMQEQYNTFRRNIEVLTEKTMELEADVEQHKKVLDVLRKTDPKRGSKYMINNVLVDLPVAEVIPRVDEMQAGLLKALETMQKDLKAEEKGLEDWKVKHNIKVVS